MLRYFYLFSMLLFTQLTFCYEYSDQEYNRQGRGHYLKLKNNANLNLRHDNLYNTNRRNKRYDYETLDDEEDSEPVAQFDVASFIQSPEDDAMDENTSYNYNNKKRRRLSKDYYEELGNDNNVEEKEIKLNEIKYYTSDADALPDQNHENKAVKTREIQKNVARNPDKKLSLKRMKFPFFSRNKTGTPKYKTQKKRKLFHLKHSKNGGQSETSTTLKLDIDPDVNRKHTETGSSDSFKISKRSYAEVVCPRCRRKYFTKNKIDSKRREKNEREINQNVNVGDTQDSVNSNEYINDHQSSEKSYFNNMYVSKTKCTKSGDGKR